MIEVTKAEMGVRRYELGGRRTVYGVGCDAVEVKTVIVKGMERFELDLLSYDEALGEDGKVVRTVNRVKAVQALTARRGFFTDARFLKQFGMIVQG